MAEKKNPSEGYTNPFFRDKEEHFEGGAMEIRSNVGSVFGIPTRSTNAMDEALRGEGGSRGKKGKK